MSDIYLYINIAILIVICIIYLFLLINSRAPRLFFFYLMTFTLFIESHFILSVTSSFSFGSSEWFFLGTFSDETRVTMIIMVTTYLLGLLWAMLTIAPCINFSNRICWQRFYSFDTAKLITFIILLISPLVVNYVISLLRFFSENGFYALYESGDKISGGFILDLLFLLLYTILICSKFKKLTSFLIIAFSLLYIILGMRLEFIFKVFPIVVYYILSLKDINLLLTKKNIAISSIIVILLVLGMQYSVALRDDASIENNFLYLFLQQQGVSINVLGLAIANENNALLSPLVVFSPIYDSVNALLHTFTGETPYYQGNSVEFAKNSLSLSHKLSFIEDPKAYLSGYGVGGASIAELYLAGGTIACLIGGMVTYYIISVLEIVATKSKFTLLFVMIIFGKIIYSPRGEYFSFLSLDRMLLLFFLLYLFIYLLSFFSPSKLYGQSR